MAELVYAQALGTCDENREGSIPSVRIMAETDLQALEPELSSYLKQPHSLVLWLPLSKKLAAMISDNIEGALELRDKLLENLRWQ